MDETGDGIARWRRTADLLRAGIRDGTFAGRLPAEAELAARFAVNRHTVRRAIAALAAEGLVRAEQGRGTFVAATPERIGYPVGERTRFSENLLAAGRQPGGRLIRAERCTATRALAALLDVAPGAPLHRLETLHVADAVPLSVATSHFPLERFPEIVRDYAESGSVTEALRRAGLADYRRRETRISAERMSREDAEHLAAAPDALALVSAAVDVDEAGRPVQALRTRFHADRMELLFRF